MTSRRPELRLLPTPPPEADAPPARRVDDIQLLAQCRAGDPDAAGALYDRARPIVARTITRLLGVRDPDRQDLAQLAMIELVRSIDRYRGECPFEAWTATITAHLVYKHIRRRRLERRALAEQVALAEEASATQSSTRELMLRSLCARVLRHLEALPRNHAWAVLLHHMHGYGMQEIATIMGSSLAAAQARVSRGRRELHQRVAANPDLAGALDLLDEEAP